MTDAERMLIEFSCSRLIVKLSHALDHPETAEPILECWADDGVWGSPQGGAKGKAAIRDLLKTVPTSLGRHMAVGILIDAIDEDHAEGKSRLLFYKAAKILEDGTGEMAGTYIVADHDDRFVRTSEGWRFAYRTTNYVLRRPV